MIAAAPAVLLTTLAGLLCLWLLWLHAEPHAPLVAPRCLYGGGAYNPAWYGPCPTPTHGPVLVQITIGRPNPTDTPWPTR